MAKVRSFSNQLTTNFPGVGDFLILQSVPWVLDELPNMSWPDKVEDDGSIISTTPCLQKTQELRQHRTCIEKTAHVIPFH